MAGMQSNPDNPFFTKITFKPSFHQKQYQPDFPTGIPEELIEKCHTKALMNYQMQ